MLLLPSLCRANMSILAQKAGLMDALVARLGVEEARNMYQSVCPMVKASIGQHVRHSMDHMELAAVVADTSLTSTPRPELHYDLRVRGGTLETDMEEAKKRIWNVTNILEDLSKSTISDQVVERPVMATFFLSAEPVAYGLPSTVARELGFAAHHAIHHMAMIRLIATNHAGLQDSDLPDDFGRAPSTVIHDQFKPRPQ